MGVHFQTVKISMHCSFLRNLVTEALGIFNTLHPQVQTLTYKVKCPKEKNVILLTSKS